MKEDKDKSGILLIIIPFLVFFTTLVFIVLKTYNILTWGWEWVLSPLWIFAGIILIIWTFICVMLSSGSSDPFWEDENVSYLRDNKKDKGGAKDE